MTKTACRFALAALIAGAAAAGASGQNQTPAADKWERVRFLLGQWEGTTEGQPGKGVSTRSCTLVLRDQFVEVRNVATYDPTDKRPGGEVHEDFGLMVYSRARFTRVR